MVAEKRGDKKVGMPQYASETKHSMEVIPMKKKAYRSLKINQIDIERLGKRTAGKDVVVGVDIAKKVQFAAFSVGLDEIVETVRFELPGQMSDFLELLDKLECSSVRVVIEPTGSYGDAFRYQVLKRGYEVFRVGTKRVSDAREVYDGVPSAHDAKCAAIIAWLDGIGASEPWPMDSEGERELNAAIAVMWMHDERYQQGFNRLEAQLARHWPEVTAIMALETVTLLTLLSTYGGPQRVARYHKEAAQVMRKASRNAMSREKISAVLHSSANTTGVQQYEAERELMAELARMTLEAKRQSDKCKARVEMLTEGIPEVQAMGQVIGKSSAAVLTCEVGSPLSFPNARAYEKSAGLNLREKSSGRHQGRLKLTKRGSGKARKYLYLAVLRLIQSDPLIKAWYDKKVERDRGAKGGKLKAIVALMRKLIRALWHVGHGNEFDSRLLFNAARLSLAAG